MTSTTMRRSPCIASLDETSGIPLDPTATDQPDAAKNTRQAPDDLVA
jgi:hypothetical protein